MGIGMGAVLADNADSSYGDIDGRDRVWRIASTVGVLLTWLIVQAKG